MVKADKCGQMGQFIKDGGQMTKQMEEVAWFMEMVMFMKESG